MKQYDFYVVPTPIGNLDDITFRAIDVLKSVDVIACEDMRVTQKLLNHYGINTKCISYHKFNERERVDKFLQILSEGKKIALVSDAGTPLFCDPGAIIVDELLDKGFSVTSLAGANAVSTFLSHVAREGEDFFFAGFMPRKRGQIEEILLKYKNTDIVFYESPNRLLDTLKIISETGEFSKVAVARELTKVFEEVVVDNVESVIEYFTNNPLKGEIVCLVFRKKCQNFASDVDDKIKSLKSKGFKAKEISVILSQLYDMNKNEVYKRAIL